MGFFFYDHSDHYEEDEFSQMVVGGSGGSLLESQPSGRASSSESLTARRGRCEVDCRRPRGGSREAKIHWEGANQMDPDGEGWCRGDFVAGLGTRFVGGLRGFVAAPIGKSTGGMTSVPSDFPRAPARPCKTTHPTQKNRRPPGRRRFSPTKRSTSRRRA